MVMHQAKNNISRKAAVLQCCTLLCTSAPRCPVWLFTDTHSTIFSMSQSQRRDSKEKKGYLRGVSYQQHQEQTDGTYLAICFKIKRRVISAGSSGKGKVICLCRGYGEGLI